MEKIKINKSEENLRIPKKEVVKKRRFGFKNCCLGLIIVFIENLLK